MKSIIKLLIQFFITVGLYSCQKQPTANFTSDKDTCTAGETIHLTDASTNAEHWTWTLPDGSISNEKNVDYPIDINEVDCTKNITLEVTSKKNKKANSLTKTITIKQAILPTDFFSYDNTGDKLIPTLKYTASRGANWVIKAMKVESSSQNKYSSVEIYIPGINRPLANGIFLLQPDTVLSSNQATVILNTYRPDYSTKTVSLSGQLDLYIENNGKMRVIFKNINAINSVLYSSYYTDTTYINISGDITVY